MAKEDIVENDEDFISLDDDEEEELFDGEELQESEELLEEEAPNNKMLYILISIFTVLAFFMLAFLLYLYLTKEDNEEKNQTENIIENIQNQKAPLTKTDSYEALVTKAKKLYAEGKKEEALAIHSDLSHYNKALTFYNIGVAKLKKNDYDNAIEAFKLSAKDKKLQFESSLNIAIAAYGKGDSELFEKYLKDATTQLSTKENSPLFAYYHALIDYYRGFYAEALVPLRNQTSIFYQKEKNKLLAKLYTAFDNHSEAINVMEKDTYTEDFFTLGLLYANQKEYTQAEKYLLKSIEATENPLEMNMALALVYIKMGLYKKASTILHAANNKHLDKATEKYPIKVDLKAALFDPVLAQKEFKNKLFFNDRNKFSLIFYFAPYRLMNPKQTINNIHQAAKNIHINAFSSALDNLKLSGKISDANIHISQGVKTSLTKNLYESSTIFQEGIKKYPSSAELHYNLALNYAKLYDFQKAHKHFKRSAVLDTNNHLAPLFSHFCEKLLFIDTDEKVLTQIEEKVLANTLNTDKSSILTLLAIARNDIQYTDFNIDKTAFEDVLVMILAQVRQDHALYQKSATSLLKKLPKNVVANILHLDAYHDKQDIKAYAKKIQTSLTKTALNFSPLYSGHSFVKELYIEMLNIAGMVPYAKRLIENRLRDVGENDIASLQALAYADIYVQEFDQAYAIYNNLIDVHKQQDSNTLFLAATASIGANHHENAIALLELSKLTNKSNLESRYALGLLYHEAQNIEGAAIQYEKIGNNGFSSRYFSYRLDKTKLK